MKPIRFKKRKEIYKNLLAIKPGDLFFVSIPYFFRRKIDGNKNRSFTYGLCLNVSYSYSLKAYCLFGLCWKGIYAFCYERHSFFEKKSTKKINVFTLSRIMDCSDVTANELSFASPTPWQTSQSNLPALDKH
jgi:hypothetical protein